MLGHLRDVGRHHQQALGIDRGLRVVVLLEALARGRHDARVSHRGAGLGP